jgi:NADH:ubiquinone oxidoreductase subunit F (NADH-binding)
MHTLLTRICNGTASMDDLELLEDLCSTVKDASLCGLGQTAPNPVLSTLKYFRNEYIEHIVNKRCPAGVCGIESQVEVLA